MKLADIKPGDVLVSVDKNGAGYYRVEKALGIVIPSQSFGF